MMSNTIQHIQKLKNKALTFLELFYEEEGAALSFEKRWRQIETSIEYTSTYFQTFEELAFGAKVAWRNSNRCIGRLYWKSLEVVDARHVVEEKEIKKALINHVIQSTNDGKIQPLITVFRQKNNNEADGMRIYNGQLINYAGYHQEKSIIGDPKNIAFTKFVEQNGWKGKRTNFDVLPILFKTPNRPITLLELPQYSVMELPIIHPKYKWFRELNLRWYALPAISDMSLEVGGIKYTAAPFSGWYMGTELGARNFSDQERYNQLPIIAQKMGLDIKQRKSLWKDRALLELNEAVLYSYEQAGVRMVDHHTASEHFIKFLEQEQSAGRKVGADWKWIVPPVSGSATSVFHQEMSDEILLPNFFYQEPLWKEKITVTDKSRVLKCPIAH